MVATVLADTDIECFHHHGKFYWAAGSLSSLTSTDGRIFKVRVDSGLPPLSSQYLGHQE